MSTRRNYMIINGLRVLFEGVPLLLALTPRQDTCPAAFPILEVPHE